MILIRNSMRSPAIAYKPCFVSEPLQWSRRTFCINDVPASLNLEVRVIWIVWRSSGFSSTLTISGIIENRLIDSPLTPEGPASVPTSEWGTTQEVWFPTWSYLIIRVGFLNHIPWLSFLNNLSLKFLLRWCFSWEVLLFEGTGLSLRYKLSSWNWLIFGKFILTI